MVFKKKSRILKRILFIVLGALIVCVTLCSLAIYSYLKPIIEESLIENNRNFIVKMSEEVVNNMEEIALYAKNITFDDTIQNFYRNDRQEENYSYFSGIREVEKKLKEYKMLKGTMICDIFFMDKNQKVLETINTYSKLVQTPYYEKYLGNNKQSGYTVPHTVNYYGVGGNIETIAYLNDIYDKTKIKSYQGELVILVNYAKLISPITFDKESDIQLELHDAEGTILYSNTDVIIEELERYYSDPIGENGWYINYCISGNEINIKIQKINNILMMIIITCLLVLLTLVTAIVNKVINPLEVLIQGMQRISDGSRDEYIRIHTGDECEKAAEVFNEMVENINTHTEELIRSEKKQYETQIKMLSYQLNPHFIYNTLNAVICLARKDSCEEIIKLTRAFIMMLQSLLKTDLQEMTTIEKEREYIDKYVEILQVCYKNIPDIQWNISPLLCEVEIPKMILYPLVENSIFHGIIPSDTASILKIDIIEKEEWVHVMIEDDGIGLNETELSEIRSRMSKGVVGENIGLFNVNARLALIYKSVNPLNIQIREEGGLVISFSYKYKKV